MNDYERFKIQMDQTFEFAHRAIDKLNVPLVQKDKLAGLMRKLREYSYQAGRAESSSNVPGQTREPCSATRRNSAIPSGWNRRSGSLSWTA